MGIGYAEPKRLLLGAGDLYINDVYVGAVKGPVEVKYDTQYAFQRPGNSLVDVKGERVMTALTVSAKLCDFKVAQLRRAFGINEAINSGSMTIRKQEILKLSGTANVSVAETIVAGTLKVSKLDRATAYVSGTDYSATSTTVTRKVGGAISTGQFVVVEYDFTDSAANGVYVGGEKTAPPTFELNFVHQLSNGKLIMVTLYKAMATSDVSLKFDEKSSGNYTVHEAEFKALADLTKPEGKNLGEIIEEDPTQAS